MFAKLQGSSFISATLLGANFSGATATAASFQDASIEVTEFGLVKPFSEIQYGTDIEGAFFDNAHADGADFRNAIYRAASFHEARLLGATFAEEDMSNRVIDFKTRLFNFEGLAAKELLDEHIQDRYTEFEGAVMSSAKLWRSSLPPASVIAPFAMRIEGASWSADRAFDFVKDNQSFFQNISQKAWTEKEYTDLRRQLESLPSGPLRQAALKRSERLDCAAPKSLKLQSCQISAPLPRNIADWRAVAEKQQLTPDEFRAKRTELLKAIICSDVENGIFVLRGLMRGSFHRPAGQSMRGIEADAFGPVTLIDAVMSLSCPASTKMTDSEKLQLKELRAAKEKFSKKRDSPAPE